ncbi:MAG: hypothetical protein P8181_01745 [bacterium]
MTRALPDGRTASDPGDVIAVPAVKELYARFVRTAIGLHSDVKARPAQLESRILYGGALVCRVVPYRELFHVQVGGEPVWEARVRDAAGCADAVDRMLARFLELYALGDPL